MALEIFLGTVNGEEKQLVKVPLPDGSEVFSDGTKSYPVDSVTDLRALGSPSQGTERNELPADLQEAANKVEKTSDLYLLLLSNIIGILSGAGGPIQVGEDEDLSGFPSNLRGYLLHALKGGEFIKNGDSLAIKGTDGEIFDIYPHYNKFNTKLVFTSFNTLMNNMADTKGESFTNTRRFAEQVVFLTVVEYLEEEENRTPEKDRVIEEMVEGLSEIHPLSSEEAVFLARANTMALRNNEVKGTSNAGRILDKKINLDNETLTLSLNGSVVGDVTLDSYLEPLSSERKATVESSLIYAEGMELPKALILANVAFESFRAGGVSIWFLNSETGRYRKFDWEVKKEVKAAEQLVGSASSAILVEESGKIVIDVSGAGAPVKYIALSNEGGLSEHLGQTAQGLYDYYGDTDTFTPGADPAGQTETAVLSTELQAKAEKADELVEFIDNLYNLAAVKFCGYDFPEWAGQKIINRPANVRGYVARHRENGSWAKDGEDLCVKGKDGTLHRVYPHYEKFNLKRFISGLESAYKKFIKDTGNGAKIPEDLRCRTKWAKFANDHLVAVPDHTEAEDKAAKEIINQIYSELNPSSEELWRETIASLGTYLCIASASGRGEEEFNKLAESDEFGRVMKVDVEGNGLVTLSYEGGASASAEKGVYAQCLRNSQKMATNHPVEGVGGLLSLIQELNGSLPKALANYAYEAFLGGGLSVWFKNPKSGQFRKFDPTVKQEVKAFEQLVTGAKSMMYSAEDQRIILDVSAAGVPVKFIAIDMSEDAYEVMGISGEELHSKFAEEFEDTLEGLEPKETAKDDSGKGSPKKGTEDLMVAENGHEAIIDGVAFMVEEITNAFLEEGGAKFKTWADSDLSNIPANVRGYFLRNRGAKLLREGENFAVKLSESKYPTTLYPHYQKFNLDRFLSGMFDSYKAFAKETGAFERKHNFFKHRALVQKHLIALIEKTEPGNKPESLKVLYDALEQSNELHLDQSGCQIGEFISQEMVMLQYAGGIEGLSRAPWAGRVLHKTAESPDNIWDIHLGYRGQYLTDIFSREYDEYYEKALQEVRKFDRVGKDTNGGLALGIDLAVKSNVPLPRFLANASYEAFRGNPEYFSIWYHNPKSGRFRKFDIDNKNEMAAVDRLTMAATTAKLDDDSFRMLFDVSQANTPIKTIAIDADADWNEHFRVDLWKVKKQFPYLIG